MDDQIAGRWWNGKYGGARRDIWLYRLAQGWRVEARQGPDTSKVWKRSYLLEHEARHVITEMIARTSGDGWRDLSRITIADDQQRGQPKPTL